MENFQLIFVFAIVIFGLISTIIYYFARYYFGDENKANNKTVDGKPKEKVVNPQESIDGKIDLSINPEPAAKEDKAPSIIQANKPHEKTVARRTLKDALGGTRNSIFGRLSLTSTKAISDSEIDQIEEALYESDIGPRTINRLIESATDKTSVETLMGSLITETESIFSQVQPVEDLIDKVKTTKPYVCLIVGVNGAGKTTSLGKLSHQLKSKGLDVLLVAGDRFRAAAETQLKVWADRAGVDIFDPKGVTDPGAVCFDACQMAVAKNYDVVLIDTAGRLSNQSHLMEELKKVQRVIKKVLPEAPHETLIVLDASTGQNAFRQAETFNEALGLTGMLLTKLDGSSKGGVAISLAAELKLPIYRIGIGEAIEDLMPFDHKEFAESLFAIPKV